MSNPDSTFKNVQAAIIAAVNVLAASLVSGLKVLTGAMNVSPVLPRRNRELTSLERQFGELLGEGVLPS
jgi:hypothetical protein